MSVDPNFRDAAARASAVMAATPLTDQPFGHSVIDGMWPDGLLDRCRAEFDVLDPASWRQFRHPRSMKDSLEFSQADAMGAEACIEMRRHLSSPTFVAALEQVTGIGGLHFGEKGSGLHRIPVDGYLGVHLDFNTDEEGRHRRLNVLVYLNRNWQPDHEGSLELWTSADSGPVVTIDPLFNRTMTFVSDQRTWHGHPRRLRGSEPRCSLAAWYFTDEPPADVTAPHDTIHAKQDINDY